jgi:WD40 repeat protein
MASRECAFSPDGQTLASGSWDFQTVKLWRVADGSLLRTMSGVDTRVIVWFSPDGQTLASGSELMDNQAVAGDGRQLD